MIVPTFLMTGQTLAHASMNAPPITVATFLTVSHSPSKNWPTASTAERNGSKFL